LTILNCVVFIYQTGCIIYTIVNYEILSKEEGWGMVAMVALFLIGLSALVVDLVIRNRVKDRKKQQIVSAIATIIFIIFLCTVLKDFF
jgi:uncharacterized membrane protein